MLYLRTIVVLPETPPSGGNNCTNYRTKSKHQVSNTKVTFGASMSSALKGACETVGELLPWYLAGIRKRRCLCTTDDAVVMLVAWIWPETSNTVG